MSAAYGFINAAARTRRGDLLTRDFFEETVRSSDVFNIAESLEKKESYRPFVSAAMPHEGSAKNLDEAIRKQTANRYGSLHRMAKDEPKYLIGILMSRYDVENIKLIIRAVHNKIAKDEVLGSVMPIGMLTEETVGDILEKSEDIGSCIEIMSRLGIHYAEPLRKGYERYFEHNDLASLEMELEKFSYRENLAKTEGSSQSVKMVHDILLEDIDFKNLMTLVRIAHEGIVPEDIFYYYIDYGKEISKKRFLRLAKSESLNELAENLAQSKYGEILKGSQSEYSESNNISIIERELELMIIKRRLKMFLSAPLSIASTIGYMAAKDLEACNLRILIEGVAGKIGETRIKEELLLV